MKCDELKPLVFSLNELSFIDEPAVQKNFENPHDHAVYKATEVDAAIAELKRKLQDQCISCPVKMQEDDVVAELKEKLEDAKATAYVESVDAGMRERRLKRSLWLARAMNARNMKSYEALDNYTRNHPSRKSRWNYISSQRYDCWFYEWDKVERKCRAKAEEY